ncbi:hypothetical protein ACN47A_24525 [Myxococcus fulvus]|uniref:hypothetical protein n=1 Tax=Myxococcus fulvus TaxID=33 RepID=UPI003B991E66
MKAVARVVLLSLVLGFTAARAEPVPPGLGNGEWLHIRGVAQEKVQETFEQYGRRAGYREGEKLNADDAKCMLLLFADGAMRVVAKRLSKGAEDRPRFYRAADWLEKEAAKACKKNGPPPGNRGMQMVILAGDEAEKTNVHRENAAALPSGWRHQLDALLAKDEWTPGEIALVGTVVLVLLAREAVPMP